MTEIKTSEAQTAYLKIIEERRKGITEFDVTITDKVQREKFEREVHHLTRSLAQEPKRQCIIVKINQP